MHIVLGNYLHNGYDSIMPIMLLQIIYVRNNEKQNYECVEVGIFFFFLRNTEVTEKISSRIGYSEL